MGANIPWIPQDIRVPNTFTKSEHIISEYFTESTVLQLTKQKKMYKIEVLKHYALATTSGFIDKRCLIGIQFKHDKVLVEAGKERVAKEGAGAVI